MILRSSVAPYVPSSIVTITAVQPVGATAVNLWQIQSWEEDVHGDPSAIVFTHSGVVDWPSLTALLSRARTVQQDLMLNGNFRCVALNPQVVTVQWQEKPANQATPTSRSITGLLEMLQGGGNVGGTIQRSFKIWRADQVFAKGTATPFWSI
jgi:hypothetical protein